jgi:hypothetical protein
MSAAWIVDDFNSDMHRLTALIDVICTLQFGLVIGETDPRVDDLLWIAREMAEGLTKHDDETPPVPTAGGANG